MNKKFIKYITYILIGALLGVLMQLMPQLHGEWGQNFFTYLASDLGSWAVICILIATYAESPKHSGFQCFACMAAMVEAYYAMYLESLQYNLRFIVLAILILPIGIVTYWYRQKRWIMIILELFLGANIVLDAITLIDMIQKGTMIVHTTEGAVFTDITMFAIVNYLLVIAFTFWGMVYVAMKYRKANKKKIN